MMGACALLSKAHVRCPSLGLEKKQATAERSIIHKKTREKGRQRRGRLKGGSRVSDLASPVPRPYGLLICCGLLGFDQQLVISNQGFDWHPPGDSMT